jgi:hypothetical protein
MALFSSGTEGSRKGLAFRMVSREKGWIPFETVGSVQVYVTLIFKDYFPFFRAKGIPF